MISGSDQISVKRLILELASRKPCFYFGNSAVVSLVSAGERHQDRTPASHHQLHTVREPGGPTGRRRLLLKAPPTPAPPAPPFSSSSSALPCVSTELSGLTNSLLTFLSTPPPIHHPPLRQPRLFLVYLPSFFFLFFLHLISRPATLPPAQVLTAARTVRGSALPT